ncbi:hypothetical protein IAU59_006985 [Kwoniella sp. CBS 9459]
MGLQSRALRPASSDIEKAPLVNSSSSSASESESDRARPAWKQRRHPSRSQPAISLKANNLGSVFLLLLGGFVFFKVFHLDFPFPRPAPPAPLPKFIEQGIEQCEIIGRPTPHFKRANSKREKNDRFVKGTKSTWLKNGTLWTGEKDGQEVLEGVSVYLEDGVIRKVGDYKEIESYVKGKGGHAAEEVELGGAWVTPGIIVDMHSHMGVDAAPSLQGNDDTNSLKNAVLPWLRSLDGFNTHDLAFNLSISGGITTMLVLPGSAGNIGGQAFPFKPRWTYENTPQSMLVEPAFVIDNGTWSRTHAWRHIKHACGENPHRVYGNTRMDSAYDFRRAYTEGKELKEKQDRWCQSPKTQSEPFPTSLEWEPLSDVIRGNVKVNIHCYETTDLNTLVRISNEFQFPIAAFHHAHEAYLVPDLLKQAWGPEPPAVAIFSTNARYKREAYRGSEFAPKVLAEAGLSVVMKSDHPVLDSRYLISEASFAHHYGLNTSQALSSVTTHPAKALGLDHRIGYIREGYDADVVVWDSHPLTVGATPKQTYIDGIPQIINPVLHHKPAQVQKAPPTGKWDQEARAAVEARGDPDLRPKKSSKNVVFQDVGDFHLQDEIETELQVDVSAFEEGKGSVLVQDGKITCAGRCEIPTGLDFEFELVDLKGGAITPGAITVGSRLGQLEIRQEKATADGAALDPLDEGSEITDGLLAHAVDGAQFGGKDELLAYRSGVTTAVVSPKSTSFLSGISFAFSPSAPHPLSHGAIQNPYGALHITLDNSKTSVSSKIAILRRLLLGEVDEKTELSEALREVAKGKWRLVVNVDKADSIATLIRLKTEVAEKAKITVLGGQEAWLVADELAEADIGVIVAPVRSYPGDWDSRRIIPSIPLSNHTLPSYLASHGVTVGLGIVEEWQARNTLYEAAWVYATSPAGVFTKRDALNLVGKNLENLLGLNEHHHKDEKTAESERGWVAHEGDVFSLGGKVRAVRGVGQIDVDLF